MAVKRFEEINEKLRRGEAVVMTASEFKRYVRERGAISLKDVDVVTAATSSVMSGVSAVFQIPVTEKGRFTRAVKAYINGVPAFPGPAPNERLGLIDVVVYGTSVSINDPEYNGGFLFRDLVEGREVEVVVKTREGFTVSRSLSMHDFTFARMYTFRSCYRNYGAFVNPGKEELETIFAVTPMKGGMQEATFAGCGELNPLANDPELSVIGVGTRVLVNAASGIIIGCGTRSTREHPNLSVAADMWEMKAEYLGGFRTSAEPDAYISIAIPIPIVSEEVLKGLMEAVDEKLPMPVIDTNIRTPIAQDRYASVWQEVDYEVSFNPENCIECENCMVERICPTKAFNRELKAVNPDYCTHCGACIHVCAGDAFSGKLGHIVVEDRRIPVVARFSSRAKAEKLAELLKKRLLEGEFQLMPPVEKLHCRS